MGPESSRGHVHQGSGVIKGSGSMGNKRGRKPLIAGGTPSWVHARRIVERKSGRPDPLLVQMGCTALPDFVGPLPLPRPYRPAGSEVVWTPDYHREHMREYQRQRRAARKR
jgi:hypothetical protein